MRSHFWLCSKVSLGYMKTCLKKILLAFSFLSSRGSGEGLDVGNILRRDEWVLCDGLCEPRSEHTWAVYTMKRRTSDWSGCLVSVPWTVSFPQCHLLFAFPLCRNLSLAPRRLWVHLSDSLPQLQHSMWSGPRSTRTAQCLFPHECGFHTGSKWWCIHLQEGTCPA